jgi:phosphate transport system protein
MLETRKRFHDELAALEAEILQMGERAQRAVDRAVSALARRDSPLAHEVIEGDDALDAMYKDIEERTFNLLATQTPVASDLRLVFAILRTSVHLERVGDQAVNIAKMALATMDLPASPTIVSHLEEMGEVVSSMLRTALDAFIRRDAELAAQLETMDEPVDRLNRNMYREVAILASDLQALEWGIRMNVVSRQLERVGDNAVDIGEQVVFLRTGEFKEFSDASHPGTPEET